MPVLDVDPLVAMQIFGSLQLGPDHGDSGPTGCTCIRVGRQGIRTPNSFVLRDSGSTGWIGPLTWAVAGLAPSAVACSAAPCCAMDHQGEVPSCSAPCLEHLGRRGQPVHPAPPFVDPVAADPRCSGRAVRGSSWLPGGTYWPSVWVSPLPFIFSVDCAALPRVDGFGLLVDGSLLFFLDHEQRRRHRGAKGTGESGRLLVWYRYSTRPVYRRRVRRRAVRRRRHAARGVPRLVRADRHEDEDDEDDLSALPAAVGPLPLSVTCRT